MVIRIERGIRLRESDWRRDRRIAQVKGRRARDVLERRRRPVLLGRRGGG
jgi:hypothetical protein